jgi:hypothetical protein
MNTHTTPHLSEDDLDEILMGIGSPAQNAHLATCDPCGERYAAFAVPFQAQMSGYNQATLDWSEARSNTISRDLAAHRPTPRLTLGALRAATAAVVVALALGVHGGMRHSLQAADEAAAPVAAVAVAVDDQHEIASDNEMLQAIDSEIGTPRPDRFGLYEPVEAPAPKIAAAQVRD